VTVYGGREFCGNVAIAQILFNQSWIAFSRRTITAAKLRERFGVPRKQLLRSMENYLEPAYLEHALASLART
jgi:hypothetical protein